jgi:hypothetical protein
MDPHTPGEQSPLEPLQLAQSLAMTDTITDPEVGYNRAPLIQSDNRCAAIGLSGSYPILMYSSRCNIRL